MPNNFVKKDWNNISEADQTHWILKSMQIYGGGFVKALAEAARQADPANLQVIKEAWPEFWDHHSKTAESLYRSDQEAKSKQ